MITTPNLALKVWNLTTDPYDSGQLANNWQKVDEHDHTPGKGLQIGASSLLDGAVTQAKIAPGVTLPTAAIPPGSITSAMFATGAVDSAAIADGTVSTVDLSTASVTSPKLKPTVGKQSGSSGIVTLTFSPQDIAGTTFTVTPSVTSQLIAIVTFQFSVTIDDPSQVASVTPQGSLVLDGIDQGGPFLSVGADTFASDTTVFYGPVTQSFLLPLSAAAHTLKLRASYGFAGSSTSGLSVTLNGSFTNTLYFLVAA